MTMFWLTLLFNHPTPPVLLSSFVQVNFLGPTGLPPVDYFRGWGRWTPRLTRQRRWGVWLFFEHPTPPSISAIPLGGLCWKPLQYELLLLWGWVTQGRGRVTGDELAAGIRSAEGLVFSWRRAAPRHNGDTVSGLPPPRTPFTTVCVHVRDVGSPVSCGM